MDAFADCPACYGTGVSTDTAEPMETAPEFKPVPLPCARCDWRSIGKTESIWLLKGQAPKVMP